MNKETAVEWLVNELRNRISEGTLDAIGISKLKMQAKELEREQIIDAHKQGQEFALVMNMPDSKEYYNETYK